MKAKFTIKAEGTPKGCHAFPKGSDIAVKLSVINGDCDAAWFYIGNDERVIRGDSASFCRMENGFECEYRFNTDELFDGDGLYFCHFEFVKDGRRYYTAFDGSFNCYLADHFVNEAQILVYDERYEIPEWMMQGVVYQIFPDRFAKGGKVTRRDDAVYDENWENGIPEYPQIAGEAFPNNTHFGGTLYGVAEKLDYLESLGVNCIYLNPIFDAYSNHKYDTADFMKVDKTFGGDKALKELIDKAHKRGMKVVLDGVFNHVGDDSVYFDAYGKHGNGACSSENSPYRDWFTFTNYPNEYESWWGIRNLPRTVRCEGYIRHITDEVIPKYMKMGIDGWRLDVVDELESHFLERIVKAVKSYKSDAIIIGEVWEDASNKMAYDERKRYFRGLQLDSVTDYPIRRAIIDFVKYGNSRHLVDTVNMLYRNYPPHKLACIFNYLGSHDTDRIATVLGGEPDNGEPNSVLAERRMPKDVRKKTIKLLQNAYLLLASLPGVPCLFYGDEIGLEGYHDPFNRRPFPEKGFKDKTSDFFAQVNRIRRSEPLFGATEMIATEERSGVAKIVRTLGDEELIIIANMSDEPYQTKLKTPSHDVLTNKNHMRSITVPAKTVTVLKNKSIPKIY